MIGKGAGQTGHATVEFDPWDCAVADDPYPTYARLREQSPVHYVAERGFWTVARFDDVRSCLRDTDTFSSSLIYVEGPLNAPTPEELARDWVPQPEYPSKPKVTPELPGDPTIAPVPFVVELDPPEHTRVRRLLVRPLRPRRMAALEAAIRVACDEFFDSMLADVRRDGVALFKASYARPLALRITSMLMGLPEEHCDHLGHLAEASLGHFALDPQRRKASETAYVELCTYLAKHFADHAYAPSEPGEIDIVNALREPDESGDNPLSPEELLANSAGLFRAGFETTANQISNAMVTLLANPEQLELCVRHPDLIEGAMEEAMRFDGPLNGMFRVTTRDAEVAGHAIPKGSMVQLLFASANRDEDHFEDADEFRVERAASFDQLMFGYGRHICLGAPLARLEARLAFETFLSRVENIRLVAPAPVQRHVILRGRTEVPIAFDVR